MASVMVEANSKEAVSCSAMHSPVHYHLLVRGIFQHVAVDFVDSSTEKCLPDVGVRNGDWAHVNAVEVQRAAGRVLESRAKALASGGAGQERKALTELPKGDLDGHHFCQRRLVQSNIAH